MISQEHFALFARYKDAPSHAFSNNHVTEADKDLYWQLYEWLIENVKDVAASRNGFGTFTSRLSRDGGVQGQRPKDLWASIINEGSEEFGKYPQVFAIANEQGLELGFSLAIHERDYFNEDVKMRARSMMPSLYRRLPAASSTVIAELDEALSSEDWIICVRHRDGADLAFTSMAQLAEFHSSGAAGNRGGGTAVKLYSASKVAASDFDLNAELRRVHQKFEKLMRVLSPRASDRRFVETTLQLDKAVNEMELLEPESNDDGKMYALRSLALRLGQQRFREQLLAAYGGKCAFTGTREALSLQAAHIIPFNGKRTHHISNGLLLRADVHNLFDRGLICVNPETHGILVSPTILCETYSSLNGKQAGVPMNSKHKPSYESLRFQKARFDELHDDEIS